MSLENCKYSNNVGSFCAYLEACAVLQLIKDQYNDGSLDDDNFNPDDVDGSELNKRLSDAYFQAVDDRCLRISEIEKFLEENNIELI